MAVTVRLSRAGKKNIPLYNVVVANKAAKRDGRFLEKIGTYNPKAADEAKLVIDRASLEQWLAKGAIMSETVGNLVKALPATQA
jgi:small subunit ribosomal protein S16